MRGWVDRFKSFSSSFFERLEGDAVTESFKLTQRARGGFRRGVAGEVGQRWLEIAELHARCRGGFAYVDATVADGHTLRLFRLRYASSASRWGSAIYRASHDDYQDVILPNGWPSGTPTV